MNYKFSRYEGEFVNGKINGLGTIYFNDGGKFIIFIEFN